MARILIVEDEEKIARFVTLELEHEGYQVEHAADGRTAVDLALERDYDLILLDVLLPQLNGMEVLRRVRKHKDVPVIMVTARDAVMDKVAGLDAGADDYLTKPFAIEELFARIRVALKRSEAVRTASGVGGIGTGAASDAGGSAAAIPPVSDSTQVSASLSPATLTVGSVVLDPDRRVLGVIRPTAEEVGNLTKTRHVGILATEGTIKSNSYKIEIQKLFPDVEVTGVACPLWAAIVEAGEADSPGADYFVKKRIDQLMRKDSLIDTVILGCTHYPLLMSSVVKNVPDGVRIMAQGTYVADSLADYLNRHPEMEQKLTKGGTCRYFTTESEERFRETARIFLHEDVNVQHVEVV